MARYPQNTHAPRLTVPAAGDATTYRLVPGPEHLQGAASMSPNHYYSVDHIMLRIDDGVTMIYVIASMAYHNILMQHLIRMNQARVYRLPYKENFVHLDVRGASPTAIQHLHNYCQIFSVKRGNYSPLDIGFQIAVYERTKCIPPEARFLGVRMDTRTNPYFEGFPATAPNPIRLDFTNTFENGERFQNTLDTEIDPALALPLTGRVNRVPPTVSTASQLIRPPVMSQIARPNIYYQPPPQYQPQPQFPQQQHPQFSQPQFPQPRPLQRPPQHPQPQLPPQPPPQQPPPLVRHGPVPPASGWFQQPAPVSFPARSVPQSSANSLPGFTSLRELEIPSVSEPQPSTSKQVPAQASDAEPHLSLLRVCSPVRVSTLLPDEFCDEEEPSPSPLPPRVTVVPGRATKIRIRKSLFKSPPPRPPRSKSVDFTESRLRKTSARKPPKRFLEALALSEKGKASMLSHVKSSRVLRTRTPKKQ